MNNDQNRSNSGNDGRQKRTYGGESGNRGAKSGFRGERSGSFGEKRGFGGNGPRKMGENGRAGGNGPRFGTRKPAEGGNGEKREGGKPAFGGDRAFHTGERRPFGGDRPRHEGEKPAFSGNRALKDGKKRPESGERRFVRGDKPMRSGGEVGKRPYGGDRSSAAGKQGGNGRFEKRDGRSFGGNGGFRRPARDNEERRPRQEQQEGLPARRLALEIIRAVTENKQYIHLVVDEKLKDCGLPLVDRRLVSRLAYDTIENQMYLDWALDQIMAKPDTDIKLRNILRLGACQILLEDRIPESAACNISVVLCKELGMEGLAGVCNGILRNLVRQKEELRWPDPETEPVKALSIRHSVPEWLVERLVADWGEEAEGLMSFHSHDSYITVRPNMLRLDDAAFEAFLKEKVWEYEPGRVAHSWRVRNMAEIGHDAGFVGGKFSIQSESSMMAAMAVQPVKGMQILDCCAAPGGKTCLMAEMMGGTGRVQAWDVHAHRADLVAAQARRLGLENVRPMARDASVPREELIGTMDAVLLDAPCSGLGVMADKPDVKYRVTPESVAELVALQAKLLDTVASYVKRGGTLVYSTCSVLKDENERQVTAFLERHPEFEAVALPDSIPEEFRAKAETGLQLLPHRDQVEGFYICRMRRKRV